MGIVAARVHDAGNLRGVGVVGRLGDGEGVQIGPEADESISPAHLDDEAGSVSSHSRVQTPIRQDLSHPLGGGVFLECEFGTAVDGTPQLGDGG
jgi:hypothetical protein